MVEFVDLRLLFPLDKHVDREKSAPKMRHAHRLLKFVSAILDISFMVESVYPKQFMVRF
jgi:hypothetical protein